jgi:UDP-glucose 4-epimerase
MQYKKFIVTGGAGFIGSHLTDRLLDLGHEIIVIDDLSTGKRENINNKANFLCFDLSSDNWTALINSQIRGADAIFYCAGLNGITKSCQQPHFFHKANVNALFNTLFIANQLDIDKIIFSSSLSISTYKTTDPYSAQKIAAENYCKSFARSYDMQATILRYSDVFGERMSDFSLPYGFVQRCLSANNTEKSIFIEMNPAQKRDFVFIDDVVEANILAESQDVPDSMVFNIGFGEGVKLSDISQSISPRIKFKKHIDKHVSNISDTRLAKDILGWKPTKDIKTWLSEKC